ncbi:MAG: hypothetical protein ACTS2F_27745 [Thainema sp.]
MTASVFTPAERFESLKAGLLGGAIALFIFISLLILHEEFADSISTTVAKLITTLQAPTSAEPIIIMLWPRLTRTVWISGAIAGFSGFLFGATYRYILRQDTNTHLKSGAVLAFGLTRGLAQADLSYQCSDAWLSATVSAGLFTLEGILLFAAIRVGLDWAFRSKWIRPFPSEVRSDMKSG